MLTFSKKYPSHEMAMGTVPGRVRTARGAYHVRATYTAMGKIEGLGPGADGKVI